MDELPNYVLENMIDDYCEEETFDEGTALESAPIAKKLHLVSSRGGASLTGDDEVISHLEMRLPHSAALHSQ